MNEEGVVNILSEDAETDDAGTKYNQLDNTAAKSNQSTQQDDARGAGGQCRSR